MTWKTWYKEHLFTPEQAVQQIKSGQRVVVAHACGEPSIILDALVANAAQYENVEIIHMVAMGKAAYCQPQYGILQSNGCLRPGIRFSLAQP